MNVPLNVLSVLHLVIQLIHTKLRRGGEKLIKIVKK
jgi:hypothetical protein